MKAVVSNRIYLSEPEGGFGDIKKALTYRLEKVGAGRGGKHKVVEIIKNYTELPRKVLSIPQGRFDLIPEGYEIVDKRIVNDMPFPDPKFALREEDQLPIYNQVNDTCFINALPGWGKTFMALHLARKFGQKTLIVTHNTVLRTHWANEVEKLFGFEPALIGTGNYDLDSSIVVGNVQTLVKHTMAISKEFGTVIMDEGHHCPASTFTTIIDSLYARYRIGLSATMTRKDGKHILLNDYFGDEVYSPPQNNTLDPAITIIKSGIILTPGVEWVKKINNLLYDEDYQNYIATIAATQISKGHKVLVIASRVEFLQRVKELLGETCLLVTGGSSEDERAGAYRAIEEKEEVSCIAGSRQIFSEGVSINRLSCVILAEPIANEANLEQIIGRVQRKHSKKIDPEVIDINFAGWTDRKQNDLRLAFYLRKGWKVRTI